MLIEGAGAAAIWQNLEVLLVPFDSLLHTAPLEGEVGLHGLLLASAAHPARNGAIQSSLDYPSMHGIHEHCCQPYGHACNRYIKWGGTLRQAPHVMHVCMF